MKLTLFHVIQIEKMDSWWHSMKVFLELDIVYRSSIPDVTYASLLKETPPTGVYIFFESQSR